jgi:hypothetical protein
VFELQRKKRTETIDREDSKHREQANLDALISKMEALLLGTKNCLVEFFQVLNVNGLLARFSITEAIFVDELPNPLGSLGPSIAREKTTYIIDLLSSLSSRLIFLRLIWR